MSPQIVFKQSTRASERKLNFESVNQHTLSSLSTSNRRWLDQSALHGVFCIANAARFHLRWTAACRLLDARLCAAAVAAVVVLYCGALTWVTDGACYASDLHRLRIVVTEASRISLFSVSDLKSLCVITSENVCNAFGLSSSAGWRKRTRSTDQFSKPPFSNQPSPAPWSTFPPVFPRYVSFFPPSSHQCISLPMWCLHVAMHLRAVWGIALWAGIWQRLIRERMSCAIPSELIYFFFPPIVLGKHWQVFFFPFSWRTLHKVVL